MSDTGSGPASPDDPFVELAGRVADAAGAVIMKYFRAPMEVSANPAQSPVTVAAGEAERRADPPAHHPLSPNPHLFARAHRYLSRDPVGSAREVWVRGWW